MFTVRSDEKGQKILSNHPNTPKEKLSYVIVKDVAEEDAFNDVSLQGKRTEEASGMARANPTE